MSSARRFPLDEPVADALTDRPAPRCRQTPAIELPSRWPVLARIAEITHTSEQQSDHSTYRVDAPHASACIPPHVGPPPMASGLQRPEVVRPYASDTERQDRVLQAVPLPIRMAVETWRLIHPQRELMRFVAMIALMIAGGMSMTMIMGYHIKPIDLLPRPATTAADHRTPTETNVQSAELQPALEPAPVPDTDTSSLAPTASGPLAPSSKPLMAIDSNTMPDAPIYPTTPYAAAALPPRTDDSLPQVRTTEPEVAHLRGDLLKTQIR